MSLGGHSHLVEPVAIIKLYGYSYILLLYQKLTVDICSVAPRQRRAVKYALIFFACHKSSLLHCVVSLGGRSYLVEPVAIL